MSALLTIDRAALFARRGDVVKADEFAALMAAHDVLAAARAQAEVLRAQTAAQVEAARREGYEAGVALARADVTAQIVETKLNLDNAFVALEGRIIQTVLNAVTQILGSIQDKHVLEPLIRRVLQQAKNEQPLRLRVCAEQFDVVNTSVATLLKEFPQIEWLDVVRDASARPGTCVLESEFGVVDASIDTQLAALRRSLLTAFVGRRIATDVGADR